MPNISSRGAKRKLADGVVVLEPLSKSLVTFLSPARILLEVPANTNTSLPVWEAMRSQQIDVTWTINPYSISVHLTPVTSKHGKSTASTQTESTSSTAHLSSSVLQPQMSTHYNAQQHSASQNSPIPQNVTQLPLNPTPALVVSLPLIAQPQPAHQPRTPTKKQALPSIQTLTATPTKLQAPCKGPVPSPFHTKSSSDVQVCDNFLLSLCRAGKKCKMHHTPYPFHWQLWSVTTHHWVDIPSHSQVLLERSYCNVSLEGVYIKDGKVRYSLSFDTMELDDSIMRPKYDGVRRLTNSDSLVKNPFFPSKWKIYWWNNLDWEEYNKDVSTFLLMKMSEKEPNCSFTVGSQEYEVDFTTMVQTNVTTGFHRAVRCRPFYRSPDSMWPYLQTGVQTEPVGDPPGVNFSVDPLEEFSSWYPPVWCLDSEQDYSLVDVPPGTPAYRSVQNLFYESLPETKVDIIGIQQVQNRLHWDKYQRQKAYMQKQHTTSKDTLERHLFHGTTKEASEDICHNNFDPRVAGVNGTSNGFGSYFATTASFSSAYSAKSGWNMVRHMFLAKVLVGKVSLGKNSYRRPPPLSSKTSRFRLYDTCVDNTDKPTMFVVFDSCQCYPYYLIKYKDLPKEVDIS